MIGLNAPKSGSNMYNNFYTLNQITGCSHPLQLNKKGIVK